MSEEKVKFTSMKDGSKEDYDIVKKSDLKYAQGLADRLIEHLKLLDIEEGPYQVSRLEHVLQTATRAYRDGADDDWVVGCLFHDIGDTLAPYTHGQLAADILRPFVRPEVVWVVEHHGTFQDIYKKNLSREKQNARDRHKESPYYQSAVDFCEKWDQASFDPHYETELLEFFHPAIQRVFSRKPFQFSET